MRLLPYMEFGNFVLRTPDARRPHSQEGLAPLLSPIPCMASILRRVWKRFMKPVSIASVGDALTPLKLEAPS